jgi:hypothetical protein
MLTMACPSHSWLACGNRFLRCVRCGHVVLRSDVLGATSAVTPASAGRDAIAGLSSPDGRSGQQLKQQSQQLFEAGLDAKEASLKLDAADAYRRALALNPDHADAREQLEAVRRILIPLARRARDAAIDLVRPNEFFQSYVSPYEALQLGASAVSAELDVKAIQNAKRRLLQEIQLNDGRVSWLNDHELDLSRAHRLGRF